MPTPWAASPSLEASTAPERLSAWPRDLPAGAIHSISNRRRKSSAGDGTGTRRLSGTEEGCCRDARRNSGGKTGKAPHEGSRAVLYPFMNARYTLQRDILDDGRPPLPRMEVPERMMDMVMTIKDLSTLPRPAQGQSSFYCLEASFDQEIYKTQVKRGDEGCGCAWYERFEISIHELTLELAKTDAVTEGPAITFVCYECGNYASNGMVGKCVIFLKDVLELPPEGGDVWTEMLDIDEVPVSGNGEMSTLLVHFRLRSNAIQRKEVPTLLEVLNRSEGDITLSQ